MTELIANQWVVMLFGICFASGLAVGYVSSLMALLTALGNKRWFWGIPMLFLGPLVGLPYSFKYSEAAYARKLMVISMILIVVPLIYGGLLLSLGVWRF